MGILPAVQPNSVYLYTSMYFEKFLKSKNLNKKTMMNIFIHELVYCIDTCQKYIQIMNNNSLTR